MQKQKATKPATPSAAQVQSQGDPSQLPDIDGILASAAAVEVHEETDMERAQRLNGGRAVEMVECCGVTYYFDKATGDIIDMESDKGGW